MRLCRWGAASGKALLVVALEGVSEPDAARVLDIDVMKLRALVEGARLASTELWGK